MSDLAEPVVLRHFCIHSLQIIHLGDEQQLTAIKQASLKLKPPRTSILKLWKPYKPAMQVSPADVLLQVVCTLICSSIVCIRTVQQQAAAAPPTLLNLLYCSTSPESFMFFIESSMFCCVTAAAAAPAAAPPPPVHSHLAKPVVLQYFFQISHLSDEPQLTAIKQASLGHRALPAAAAAAAIRFVRHQCTPRAAAAQCVHSGPATLSHALLAILQPTKQQKACLH
jgi:hypothetical protein